jgi:hypothetical protein
MPMYAEREILTSNATKAKIGDRSKVPPMGGMIPLQAMHLILSYSCTAT